MPASSEPSAKQFAVSIIMERRAKQRGQWSFTEWEATGVLPAPPDAPAITEKKLIHADEECERYRWTPFTVELHKDCAESYWSNLMADNPSLFIVCREEDEDGELEPFFVTADYDEIIGAQEVDDQVFSVPIPPEIYHWLEAYVVNNYTPPERRKRKRSGVKSNSHGPASTTRH